MSNIGDVIETIIKPTTIRTKLRGDILLNEPLVMIKIRKIIMHGDNVLPTDAHGDKKRIIAVSINEKIHVFKFNHHHTITLHKCMIKRVNGPTHADEHTSCRTTTDKTINKHACMGSLWLTLNKRQTPSIDGAANPATPKSCSTPSDRLITDDFMLVNYNPSTKPTPQYHHQQQKAATNLTGSTHYDGY